VVVLAGDLRMPFPFASRMPSRLFVAQNHRDASYRRDTPREFRIQFASPDAGEAHHQKASRADGADGRRPPVSVDGVKGQVSRLAVLKD
jgi:hypothetical protein